MTIKHSIESLESRSDEYNKRARRIVKLSAAKKCSLPEVVQLCLDAFKSWVDGDNPSRDFNLAQSELAKFDSEIKLISRSEADSDTIHILMTDGVTYRVTVTRYI